MLEKGNKDAKQIKVAFYGFNRYDEESYRNMVQNCMKLFEVHPDWQLGGIFIDDYYEPSRTYNQLVALCKRGAVQLVAVHCISQLGCDFAEITHRIRQIRETGACISFSIENLSTREPIFDEAIELYQKLAKQESAQKSKSMKESLLIHV